MPVSVLNRASAGYLMRHPVQLALALLGICIGIAVMVAVDLANGSARKAFELSMETINGRATHQVIGGPGDIDEDIYVELRVVHGYTRIAPLVTGYAGIDSRSLTLLGVDAFAEQEVRSFTTPGDASGGRLPLRELLTTPGAVLMSVQRAAQAGLAVGDRFELTANGRVQAAVLVGELGNDAGDSAVNDLLVTDIATAQAWLAKRGRLSRIDVVLPESPQAERALQEQLPAGVQLLPASGRSRSVTEMSTAFATNLTAMSLLAMLVGVFLIYNSVSFAVLQRRALFGTLRALGVTGRQVFCLILREAVALGAVGAVLGVVLGLWLGQHLLGLVSQSINDLYFRVSVSEIAISPWSIAKGVGAGLLATLAAAVVPAAEAASVSPRLSLSRSTLEARTGTALSRLALAGLGMVLAASLLLWVSGDSLVAGLAALFLLLLGVALWIPPLVRLAATVLAPVARRIGGSAARIAIAGVAASLSRTGVAVVALAIAVSATTGVTIMVDSFRASVSNWIGQSLQSDFYVGVADGSPIVPALVDDLVTIEGVAEYSSSRRVWLETDAGLTRLVALQMAPRSAAGIELLDAQPDAVWPAFEAQAAVLISETLAYRRDLGAGDALYLMTTRGRRAFTVAAVYRSYDANAGSVLMNRGLYDTFWNDDAIDSLGIYLQNGADATLVMQRLQSMAEGRQLLVLRSNQELRALSLSIFDRTFVITDVLYWLAVGVAIIGILGAMLALQMERAREFGVLRALGMTPLQLGGMVTLQSGFMGALSGLAAIPLGLLMARVLIDVINRRAFGWTMPVDVDPVIVWTSLGLSIGAALLAGIYPALRAATRRAALAMRED